ncbi:35390_t:CDS:2, partial [Racocetra persica]
NKEEIIKASINLIWKASGREVTTVTFSDPLRSAKIAFDNGTNITVNLDLPGVVIIKEETFRKIITEFSEKDPVIIDEKGIQDSDESEETDELIHDVQINENDILNSDHENTNSIGYKTIAKTVQQTELQQINNFFKSSKRIEKDQHKNNNHSNENQQRENMPENIEETDESLISNLQSVNVIGQMAKNTTQADIIDSNQDNNNYEKDLDRPHPLMRWSHDLFQHPP